MRNEKSEGKKENFFEKEKEERKEKIIKIGLYERKRNR